MRVFLGPKESQVGSTKTKGGKEYISTRRGPRNHQRLGNPTVSGVWKMKSSKGRGREGKSAREVPHSIGWDSARLETNPLLYPLDEIKRYIEKKGALKT